MLREGNRVVIERNQQLAIINIVKSVKYNRVTLLHNFTKSFDKFIIIDTSQMCAHFIANIIIHNNKEKKKIN